MWAPAKIPLMRMGQFDPLPPLDPFPPMEPMPPIQTMEPVQAPQPMPASPRFSSDEPAFFKNDTVRTLFWLLDAASMGASAYHGYKRNNSVGWAIWWAIMGGVFPIITPAIALAQGFGKPIKK